MALKTDNKHTLYIYFTCFANDMVACNLTRTRVSLGEGQPLSRRMLRQTKYLGIEEGNKQRTSCALGLLVQARSLAFWPIRKWKHCMCTEREEQETTKERSRKWNKGEKLMREWIALGHEDLARPFMLSFLVTHSFVARCLEESPVFSRCSTDFWNLPD